MSWSGHPRRRRSLGDRRGVGEARRLYQDAVEPLAPAHQRLDDADQVPAHRAADAAIVHFEHLLVGIDDEIVIDADLAELVDDDRELLAMRLGEDAVEKRGLSCSEIAGEDGDGGGDKLIGH